MRTTQAASTLINSTHRRIGRSDKPINYIPDNAVKVFIAMSAVFGRLWESQFGEVGGEAFKIWAADLQSLTNEEILTGINNTKINASKKSNSNATAFPPNLFEFTSLCREKIKHPSHRLYLPKPDGSHLRERGKSKLAEMRMALNA